MVQTKSIANKRPSALTVRDVADYLHVDEKTVYRLVQKRELPGFKVAGTWRFRQEEIDSWIDASREGSSARTRSTARLRALIVEDDVVDRMAVRNAIRETDRLGAVDIVEVSTLDAAREALGRARFDCVVIDRQLPDGDGVSLLDDDGDPLRGAAVVVLTGLEDEDIARAALRRGAQDYLIKGRIEGHMLLRSIRYAIERKRLEEQRHQHESNFRALIEQSPDAMAVMSEGELAYINPAFCRLTGRKREEIAEVVGLVHPEDAVVLEGLINQTRRGERQDPLTELRLRSHSGGWVLVEAWTSCVLFDDEEAILLSARDVTRRKHLEEQVVFSSRMAALGTLAAGVAHEINNPLAFVTANLDFALSEFVEFTNALSRQAETEQIVAGGRSCESLAIAVSAALNEARQGASRINYIVRDMKTLARPTDTGDTPVSLRQAVDWSVGVAWNEIRHRARLVKDFRANPTVGGGEARVGQVAMNLLVNAAHAIAEGNTEDNEIRIVVDETNDGRAILEVRDTGAGIPNENLERIFHPFFTTKPVGKGTGLGLAVCHGIVTALGGSITVQSVVGQGTTFRVVLPSIVGPRVPTAAGPPTAPRRSAVRGRILIVDDEEMLADALARYLSRDHEVTVATGGQVALKRLTADAPYDVVLCDLMMPDLSGMELYEAVVERHRAMAPRMIFMTGGAFTPKAQQFRNEILNLCLDKPVDLRTLSALVNDRVALIRTGPADANSSAT